MKNIRYNLPFSGCRRNNCEQSIGVNVKAPTVETIMMILTIHPNCLNKIPAIPVTIVNGKNTANIVRVEAITEIATSFVACTAACFGWLPRSIWVVTFANTTIASSTTIPIAIESELNEIMFNVLPEASK